MYEGDLLFLGYSSCSENIRNRSQQPVSDVPAGCDSCPPIPKPHRPPWLTPHLDKGYPIYEIEDHFFLGRKMIDSTRKK